MAKIVQIRRGTAAENNEFTGMVGEITATTDTHNLRIHDGSTKGGFELASKSDLLELQKLLPSMSFILSTMMPVGYIYLSMNATNPAQLFGFGTWERMENRYLIGAGSGYAVGSTGGNSSITLSTDQMPAHAHGASGWSGEAGWHDHSASTGAAGASGSGTYPVVDRGGSDNDSGYGVYVTTINGAYSSGATIGGGTNHTHSVSVAGNGKHTHAIGVSVDNAGGGKAIDIHNPYIAVYMWRRTA